MGLLEQGDETGQLLSKLDFVLANRITKMKIPIPASSIAHIIKIRSFGEKTFFSPLGFFGS